LGLTITDFGQTELVDKRALGEWGGGHGALPPCAFRAMNKAAETVNTKISLQQGDQKSGGELMQTANGALRILGLSRPLNKKIR